MRYDATTPTAQLLRSASLRRAPAETLDALSVLLAHRYGELHTLDTPPAPGEQRVWTVEASDQEAGPSDLDDRPRVTGVYTSLAVAVAATWRQIVTGERIYYPVITQRALTGVLDAAPLCSGTGPDLLAEQA